MWNFDFDDLDRNKIRKYSLIAVISFFSIVALFLIFPFLFYTIIFLGIVVPAYFLIKNYKKNNYEE